MHARSAVAAVAVFGVACASHPRAARTPAAPAPVQQTAFQRQIQNARDAGDGDYQLRALREKVAASPDDVAARVQLAALYRDRGYPDVALEMCRLAAARFPQSAAVQLALARALRDLNQRPAAIAGLETFLADHPQASAEFFSWLGILRDESGQWSAGEPHHRKALEQAPAEDYLHNNLGYNLLMQKKDAEAAAEFREALRLNPASLMARNNLGLALASQDANAQAIASFESGTDASTAHNNMAAVLIEKGNYREARKELELALGYNRANPAALRNLELVSRLDGSAAIMPAQPGETTRWERWKSGFTHLFVGPLEDTRSHPQ
jgi:Flp pilus assembly protein TadD